MSMYIWAMDQNIIYISNNKVIFSKNVIHSSLKKCWGIFKTKWYHPPLVKSCWENEIGFMPVLWLDLNLIISRFHIKLTKHLAMLDFLHNCLRPWKWIIKALSNGIEGFVIYHHPWFSPYYLRVIPHKKG